MNSSYHQTKNSKNLEVVSLVVQEISENEFTVRSGNFFDNMPHRIKFHHVFLSWLKTYYFIIIVISVYVVLFPELPRLGESKTQIFTKKHNAQPSTCVL